MAVISRKKPRKKPFVRGAGVLLPVSSLPSPYGIGSFGKEAFEFVNFLKRAGQSYWQVLPLGPTSYGDSPYQSFSAFAGNPYFIDLTLLGEEGLLTAEELGGGWGSDPGAVDYALLFERRFEALRMAFARSHHARTPAYKAFCKKNESWLADYALFMALKHHFGERAWGEWPRELRFREAEALKKYGGELAREVEFWRFCQFQFFRQWYAVKEYANENGIEIIGDIPIYAALDSADVWAHPEGFQLDGERRPICVAGVPPDLFSATGQLWGNPLYDWDAMERDGFTWWRARMAASAGLFDVIRIDHFIGVVRYFAIPAEDDTAKGGEWRQGPGLALIKAIDEALGGARVIAEDLGVVTPAVRALQKRSGYPGMKVLAFAFDSGPGNDHLPCHWAQNTVAYAGTHDNETLVGYFKSLKQKPLRFAKAYLNVRHRKELPAAAIRAVYAGVAHTAILQAQDWLGLDNSARMNSPSTLGGNWQWRLPPGRLTEKLAGRMLEMTKTYDRYTEKEN